MGFFGTYLYESGRWSDRGDSREASEPWLFLNIYDSDIATVMYRPAAPGTGMAFLGTTPRSYFDDETASLPTDVALESAGLAAWWASLNDSHAAADRAAKEAELAAFLAGDTDPYADWPPTEDVDDADLFVEIKAGRFLHALGLAVPDDLHRP